MFNLNHLKISVRLPLVVVLIVVVLTAFISTSAFMQAGSVVEDQVKDRLNAVLASRDAELSAYLGSIREDLNIVAANTYTLEALRTFEGAWNAFEGGQMQTLQSLYITTNPHPTGEKDKLYNAGDDSTYSVAHAKYHPWFHKLQQEREYYDVFLFDLAGNLVYSVFKELDYATNMNTGEWRQSDLANAFRAGAKASNRGNDTFFDFLPYKPSFDAPASFISRAIEDENGQIAGVLVFQMPIGRLNRIMQNSEGMGETGESFVVGADHLMRTDSRFSSESTILKTRIDGASVNKAISGGRGLEIVERQGKEIVSAYTPFEFLGTKWAILAEIDVDEMNQPITDMGWVMISIGLVFSIAMAIIGFFFARTITTPIKEMVDVMRKLADGDDEIEVPCRDYKDEIGEMAGAVEVFKQNSIDRRLMQEEADKDQAERKERDDQRQQEENARVQEDRDRERELSAKQEAVANEMAEVIKTFDAQTSEMLESVSSAAVQLESTAQSMSETADATNVLSAAVAAASEEATMNVQAVASATE